MTTLQHQTPTGNNAAPPTRPIDVVLRRIGEPPRRVGRGWSARCPAHQDHTPSLSIAEGEDGRVLLYDHAGCTPTEIVEKLGLTLADLFPGNSRSRPGMGLSTQLPRPGSPLEEARREILLEGRRQRARLAPYGDLFTKADAIRASLRVAADGRRCAQQLGDCEPAWDLLTAAAVIEIDAQNAEAELDAVLAERRKP